MHPSPNSSSASLVSKGQIHLKLVQARALNVRTLDARPYVVVQFEQNEFVSREPIRYSDVQLKPTPPARNLPSVLATKALKVAAPSPVFPHSPIWKHAVSFDVTSENSQITCIIYDRSASDHGFLGTVKIKPVLTYDQTIEGWYKLQPIEQEEVSGEIHVTVTFEQYKIRRSLTPRDFEFLKLIGVGTFGKVFQVRKRDTRRIYAMKVLSKKEIVAKKEITRTIGERKILQRSLDSPFLVGLKFSFQTLSELYLITDFKSGGELFWHLQRESRFSEDRARFYVAELTLALEHLHKYNIVYRDLKPENILLDATGHVALCDFGLSKANFRPDELTRTVCGTTEYLAPEILLDEQGYSKVVDFWSLGVLFFEMCCGWSPFYAEDVQKMYENICFGKIRFPKGIICEQGKQFVKGLLIRNPKFRLGAQRDASEIKEHPFFSSIDWNALVRKEVVPPFKPNVESDESVDNFDPQFTSSDISSMNLANDNGDKESLLSDDDDPSGAWVDKSINQQKNELFMHTPNGPLGSERSTTSSTAAISARATTETLDRRHTTTVPDHVGFTTPTGPRGIDIKFKSHQIPTTGTPLTNSVQENFKGFTYFGESFVIPPGVLLQQIAVAVKQSGMSEMGVADYAKEESVAAAADDVEDMRRKKGHNGSWI